MGNICGSADQSAAEEGDRVREIGIGGGGDGKGRQSEVKGDKPRGSGADKRKSELFSNVSLSCRTALSQLESFGESMVARRFRTDLHSHHLEWMHLQYEWLLSKEKVPKNLGERLPADYFSSLTDWRAALSSSDALLQRLRLALELSARDANQAGEREDAENFLRARDYVKSVNFEVANAMDELKVVSNSPVKADFLPPSVRPVSPPLATAARHQRDWVFYRDARNATEFVAQLFDHLAAEAAEN